MDEEQDQLPHEGDIQPIEDLGSSIIRTDRGTIYVLTIVGQIEGHQLLPPTSKSTKYEHVLPLLASIEEEAGSEASAHEIVEITGLVNRYDIPAIFTEVNGSAATANSISRETGCQVRALNMIMDGEEAGVEGYVRAMEENLRTIWEAFQ